jgi:DNA polymerase III subunit gamma/tau
MSYLALARKWRPPSFADVMGQGHVVKALEHALSGDKLHPAILLTGTRGVGKTTLARIVAKGLNCETGVSATPCGSCSACREVDEGRSVDMLEIDAASNTGVENIREIIENSQYAPARSRYKVYLVDEVHMLSKGAFNALLKTLEEPPPHVKFILATTDPQKLPVTVLSRCLQFNLKRLPVAVIREQMEKILEQEKIQAEPAALQEIARAADGSMRDALSLLDQAIAFAGGGSLSAAQAEEMLGTSGRRVLAALLEQLAAGDAQGLTESFRQLEMLAPDYAALINDLSATLQRIAVLQLLPAAQTADDDPALLALAARLAPEDVQLYYQIAVLGRRDLPWAPAPRLGFEMTLLRMFAFRPEEADGSRLAPPAAATHGARHAPGTVASATPPSPGSSAAGWGARVDALGLEAFTKALARNCVWLAEADGELRLQLDAKARHLLTEERRQALEQALSAQAGAALRVHVELAPEAGLPTPARLDAQADEARQQSAERAVAEDRGVQAMQDLFGASIRPGSIQSLH